MQDNEKAHLRGTGLLINSTLAGSGNQTLVSARSGYSASAVIDACVIADIWRALGGGELRRGRGRAFWRNGDGFTVSLNPKRGIWHHFPTNEGGGVLDLIQTVRGCTRSEALRWLADLAGMSLTPNSLERRRRYAEASQRATESAKLAGWWFESQCEELEKLKRLNNGDDGPFDEDALTAVAGELYQLHQLGLNPDELITEFVRASQLEPENTRRLVQAGRAHQEQEDEVKGRIVAHPWVPR